MGFAASVMRRRYDDDALGMDDNNVSYERRGCRYDNSASRPAVSTVSRILAAVALMGSAVIYGTDVFCALVQRPALAEVDGHALTSVMGRIHQYGGRRLPVPGALGIAATVAAATTTAVIASRPAAAAAAAVVLAAWLVIYLRISAPVNRTLTAAATTGQLPPDARSLQRKWDSVILIRAILQGVAVAALCAALALP
jgi:Domain of unknown function (DUF1772)